MKYLDNNGLSYLIQKIKIWLTGKVDKIEGKTLTTNDFTNDYKIAVDANTAARHSHSNKTALDTITADKIAEWDSNSVEEVFVWDGKSNSENSANLALFQKIYNAWASNKKILVITIDGNGDTFLLSRTSMLAGRLMLYDFHTEITKSARSASFYTYTYKAYVNVGSDGVVTSVDEYSVEKVQGSIVQEEKDPIFTASAAYGISSDDIAEWNGKAETNAIPTKVSQLTNDSKYQTESQVQTAINNKLSSVMNYKGTVANYSSLPTNANVGDTYNITNSSANNKAGDNAVWNGTSWDVLSGAIDLSGYVETSDLVAITNAEIDTIVA